MMVKKTNSQKPIRVLFVCTQNSNRSQMAEGFLKKYGQDSYEVFSAGVNPGEVNPLAVEAMREIGIDISGQTSDDIMDYIGKQFFQYVIIVCSQANQSCPQVFPGVTTRLYWPFEDPAAFEGSEDEIIEKFREVRDLIGVRIKDWVEETA